MDKNTAWMSVDGLSIGLPAVYANARYDKMDGGHGPGMHSTCGAISRLKLENVCNPEQPLKSCPSVMVVTVSSGEMVNAMGLPWIVVPLH